PHHATPDRRRRRPRVAATPLAPTKPENPTEVTQKPTGRSVKYAAANPAHTVTSASPTDRASPSDGRAVSAEAVAAGTTTSASTSSTPVNWLASATAQPSRIR